MGCSIDPNPKPLSRRGADPDALTSDAVIAADKLVKGSDGTQELTEAAWGENSDGDLVPAAVADAVLLSPDGAEKIYSPTDSRVSIYVNGGDKIQVGPSTIKFLFDLTCNAGAMDIGTAAASVGRISVNGLQVEYVETASAQYTADDQDHTIVLTAATAELILPAATIGTQKCLVQFTGASSRTVTPDGSDTVDVGSPTQNKHYWIQSDGVSHWKMVLMD